MKCLWCKGTKDGDDDTPVTGQKKPWMLRNKHGVGNKSKSSGKETAS